MSADNNRGTAGVMRRISNGESGIDFGQWNAERMDVPPPQLRIAAGITDTVDVATASIDRRIVLDLIWNVGEARFSASVDACNGTAFSLRAHYLSVKARWPTQARHMAQSAAQVNLAVTRDVGEPIEPPTYTDSWTASGGITQISLPVPAFARSARLRYSGSMSGYGLMGFTWLTAVSGGTQLATDLPLGPNDSIRVPQGARYLVAQSFAVLPAAVLGGLIEWELRL